MKKIFVATTALALVATMASASNFNNTQVLSFSHGNVTVAASANKGKLDVISGAVTVLPATVLGVNTNVTAALAYNTTTNQDAATVGLNASKTFGRVTAYGTVAETYVKANGTVTGSWVLRPTVGASVKVLDNLNAYAEVGRNFWNATDNYSNDGKYAAIGVNYTVGSVTVSPSVSRTFNTTNNQTNFNVAVGVKF